MPVLPLVASITVWPGLSAPDFSAASITPSARRSFTEPSGLNASILTNRLTCGALSRVRRVLRPPLSPPPPHPPDPRAVFPRAERIHPSDLEKRLARGGREP